MTYLITPIVYILGSLWTLPIYLLLNNVKDKTKRFNDIETLGLSLILGILSISVVNYFASILIGGFFTGIFIIVVPLIFLGGLYLKTSKKILGKIIKLYENVRIYVLYSLIVTFVSIFIFHIWLTSGHFFGDIPFHVNHSVQLAFNDPGILPANPIMFPKIKPYMAFVPDSLVSMVFRYLNFEITPFHYSEILFAWGVLLWLSLFFIAGSFYQSMIILIASLIIFPFIISGSSGIANFNFVNFYANPNSLVAYPLGLILTLHIFKSFKNLKRPSLLLLLLIPPASIFFKPNNAPAFLFLQIAGLIFYFRSIKKIRLKNLFFVSLSFALWILFYLMTKFIGPSPISFIIKPSLQNIKFYSAVAFDSVKSGETFLKDWLKYAASILGIFLFSYLFKRKFPQTVFLIIFCISILFLFILWFSINPAKGGGTGEPVHTNFILTIWIATIILLHSIFPLLEKYKKLFLFIIPLSIYIVFFSFLKNTPLKQDSTKSIAEVIRIRNALKGKIPQGHCYGYNRKFAIFIESAEDIDFAEAVTGCPFINGLTWREMFGFKSEEELLRYKNKEYLESKGGGRYKVIRY